MSLREQKVKYNGTEYIVLGKINYQEWRNSIIEALKGHDLYWLIDPTEATSEELKSLSKLNNERIKDDLYIKANRAACHLIFANVSVEFQNIIANIAEAAGRWSTIQEARRAKDRGQSTLLSVRCSWKKVSKMFSPSHHESTKPFMA
jgi:hypothetical protein